MLLDLQTIIMSSKCVKYFVQLYKAILYSFLDENGNRYDGSTTLTVNGENILAINSPRVCV